MFQFFEQWVQSAPRLLEEKREVERRLRRQRAFNRRTEIAASTRAFTVSESSEALSANTTANTAKTTSTGHVSHHNDADDLPDVMSSSFVAVDVPLPKKVRKKKRVCISAHIMTICFIFVN